MLQLKIKAFGQQGRVGVGEAVRLHFLAHCKVSFCVRVLGALQWAKNSVGSVGKVSGCVNRYAVSSRVTYNEQGLALLGYLKNVSPQLKPNIVLKVEVKN